MIDVTIEAVGKWHGIYSALGINVGDGRHCPCPVCQGKDRFRMDDKDGRGTWFCNSCGAGDGFKLLQLILGMEFKEVVKEVAKIIGSVDIDSNIPKEKKISRETLRKIFTTSTKATESCIVGKYLKNRGLSVSSGVLRLQKKCYEPETKREIPAMLAVFMSSDGEAVTMHRTFLDGRGRKADITKQKKILPGLSKLPGGAIRLFEPVDGMVAVAEGIETALAVNEMMNIPCWSVVSTQIMEAFVPPKGITTIHIMADNDRNYAGQKSAYVLANKLALKGFSVSVMIPSKSGDWLDELNRDRNI